MADQDADQSFLASEDVSQFIGKNAAYYQGAWTQAALKAGSLSTLLQLNRPAAIRNRTAGWNWAAFFFSIGWLIYRKMYVWAFALLAAVFGIGAIEEFTGKDLRPVYLTMFVMAGYYGNAWYLGHTHKRVTDIQKATSDAGARKLLLGGAGGTNLVGAALGFLATTLVVVALSVPQLDTLISESVQPPATSNIEQEAAAPVSPPLQTAKPSPSPSALPGWQPWLAEINGLWTSERYGKLQIFFSPQRMLIKSLHRPMGLEVLATDRDSETVTFHITFNVGVMGQEVTSGPADEWTIQRAWNEDHTRFGLILNSLLGQEELGFVRRLLPNEEAALVSAQSIQEAQTKPSYTSAGAALVSGNDVTFQYQDPDVDGGLDIKMSSNDTLIGHLNTVHKTSTHVCDIEMEGILLDRQNIELRWKSEDAQCSIRIGIEDKNLSVSGSKGCEGYCGMGGRFHGDYTLAP
ncbi:MAG: DUF2628 domain-containing protein [Rhodospirillaceae bacterium]|nr:DUF2628 domain-containing protein [Rhodospirillaceae bacterium]